jgi:hypothetical protein
MLATGAGGDVLRLVGKTVFLRELLSDGGLELGEAGRGRVLGLALVEGGLGGVLDERGGVKVRLAGAEADDVDAGLLERGRLGTDLEGDRFRNELHPLGKLHGYSVKTVGRKNVSGRERMSSDGREIRFLTADCRPKTAGGDHRRRRGTPTLAGHERPL